MTTIGKYRHLSHCSTTQGIFCIVAIDHRANLLQALKQHSEQPLSDADFTTFKLDVMRALLPAASAVLVDPRYGISVGIAERTIPGRLGLLAPIEVTDYDLHPSKRSVDFIPDWGVDKIKRMGGDGVKLLLPYHPQADNAAEKRAIVERIAAECMQHDIPFFLEPIAYTLDPAVPLDNVTLRQIVVEMARTFSTMGVDILKMQFPVDAKQSRDEAEWRAACDELNAACTVPWALLSAGVDYETFRTQARIACEAGASGVIVGRAVWAEAVSAQGQARQNFLQDEAHQRMSELLTICEMYATPWWERTAPPAADSDWYTDY